MIELLRSRLGHADAPVGTILHIGAGRGRELEIYSQVAAQQIVLVEPDPNAVAGLKQKTSGHENVTVMALAISEATGLNRLHVMNVPDFNSLRVPCPSLKKTFPDLRVVKELDTDVINMSTLLDRLPVKLAGPQNWLVVEAPGEEFQIIEALKKNGRLEAFQNIFIRGGRQVYFEGSQNAQSVKQKLEQVGYGCDPQQDLSVPDWPCYYLRLAPPKIRISQLKNQLQKANDIITQSNADVLEARKSAATLAEKNVALEAKTAQATAQAVDAGEILKKSIKEKDQKIAATQKELEASRRLLALAASDLNDLQQRYKQTLAVKAKQEDLLFQLSKRLDAASQYLHLLADEGTGPGEPDVAQLGGPDQPIEKSS